MGYDERMKLSPHFSLAELTTTGTGLANVPHPAEVSALVALCDHVLEPVRALLGVPLRVNSGYRSEAVNAAIKGAARSQHMRGEAADVVPVGMDVETAMARIAEAVRAKRLTVDQAIAYHAGGFLHLSYASLTKNRCELLRSSARGGSGGPYAPWTP